MRNPSSPSGGLDRRDTLKSLALMAAAPFAAAAQTGTALPSTTLEDRRAQRFDTGWRFFRGDAPGAEAPGFDDAPWRTVDLPHDWSVEALPPRPAEENGANSLWGHAALPVRVGPFDTELSQGGRDTGWFVGGTGWYRKRFSAASIPAGRLAEILFDGVYMNSDVWLNGTLLGNHPYGYTAFAYDLTPHLRRDGENVIAVRVRNEGRNSRWYSGSGIYRHVWLNVTAPVRVPLWSLFVSTPEVSPEKAAVKVSVAIENRGTAAAQVTAQIRLFGPDNRQVAVHETVQPVEPGARAQVEQTLSVAAPKLWSLAAPSLYRAEIELIAGGQTADRISTPFGIRKVEIDAARGLRLNGEPLKLKGGCLHHDNGLLGACAIDRAEERRIELMKAAGFNAIRTSHNPPSPAFLDACDRLGMLVLDEAFDQWQQQKNAQDYHLYFDDWWRRDLEAMVLRDRNHPSVILWSIGNEIAERAEPAGVELARQLTGHIRSMDATRPILAAINGSRNDHATLDPAFRHLDIGGYNYLWGFYEPDHARYPERIILGTESFPQQAFENWDKVEKLPYVIGDFVWTGMDHLGESSIGNAQIASVRRAIGGGGAGGPGAGGAQPQTSLATVFSGLVGMGEINLPFPWFNCYCGDIDLIGQPKAQWYFRRVVWGASKLEMAVQRPLPAGRSEAISAWGWSDELRSWTWPGYEGRALKVRVYSTGDQVRLLLNGREIGLQPVSAATVRKAEFDVPYTAGELKAIALAAGQPIAELTFKTAGKPARLRLRADRPTIRRTPDDLAYVTLEVTDRDGNLIPDAAVPVAFSVTGACALAAAGTANPKDVFSFRSARPTTFHGQALAILRPRGTAGEATVRATAEGMAAGSVMVKVE